MAMDFNFVLTNSKSNGVFTTAEENETTLLSNDAHVETSILSNVNEDGGMDAFGGKDIFGTIDLSNMDESLFANAGTEAAGSIAMGAEAAGSIAMGTEAAGSIAMGGAEAAGSVACGSDSGSGGGSFSSFC